VRWTEAQPRDFLELVGEGRVAVSPLVTHRFTLNEARLPTRWWPVQGPASA
jgi:hypothetical protein